MGRVYAGSPIESPSAVAKMLRQASVSPADARAKLSWRDLVDAHADSILACEFAGQARQLAWCAVPTAIVSERWQGGGRRFESVSGLRRKPCIAKLVFEQCFADTAACSGVEPFVAPSDRDDSVAILASQSQPPSATLECPGHEVK